METDAENLAAYCGRFCGTCGISDYQIGTGIAAVQAVVNAAGFKREAEHLGWPLMRDIATQCCAQFEGQVGAFASLATRLFPTHCRGGCVPPCEIAACCKSKGHATCADCGELETCGKIAGAARKHPALRGNLQAIAREGLRPWSRKQLKAARDARRRQLAAAVEKAVG